MVAACRPIPQFKYAEQFHISRLKYLNQLAILYQINIALNKEDKLDEYMAEYQRLQQMLERPISLVERMLIQSWLARYVRINVMSS